MMVAVAGDQVLKKEIPSGFVDTHKSKAHDDDNMSEGRSSNSSRGTTAVAFSDYRYPVMQDEEEGELLFKVRGKPGIKRKHLLMIPLLTFMNMLTGVDVM